MCHEYFCNVINEPLITVQGKPRGSVGSLRAYGSGRDRGRLYDGRESDGVTGEVLVVLWLFAGMVRLGDYLIA